nr:hypothetical protein CFP56_78904 [Quercus suber]
MTPTRVASKARESHGPIADGNVIQQNPAVRVHATYRTPAPPISARPLTSSRLLVLGTAMEEQTPDLSRKTSRDHGGRWARPRSWSIKIREMRAVHSPHVEKTLELLSVLDHSPSAADDIIRHELAEPLHG